MNQCRKQFWSWASSLINKTKQKTVIYKGSNMYFYEFHHNSNYMMREINTYIVPVLCGQVPQKQDRSSDFRQRDWSQRSDFTEKPFHKIKKIFVLLFSVFLNEFIHVSILLENLSKSQHRLRTIKFIILSWSDLFNASVII